MAGRVWKFDVPPFEEMRAEGKASAFEIEMPASASILHAADQGGCVELWAFVDDEAELQERRFILVGTGHEIPELDADQAREHVGTVLTMGGAFVWHIFEIRRRS